MKTDDLAASLDNVFAKTIKSSIELEQVIIEVAASDLLKCCYELRDNPNLQFAQLLDVCAIDYLHYGMDEWTTNDATFEGFSRGINPIDKQESTTKKDRFAVYYNLLSTSLNQRLRVKVFAPGNPPILPSVIDVWASANWYEREAFDLFGILFSDHPDLRRLLTDYGFVGHPFRKDFPLIGQLEMRYDANEQRVLYEKVSIEPRTLVPRVIRHKGK